MKSHLHIDSEVEYTNVSCDEIIDLIKWKDAKVLTSLLVLAIINIIVIVGNCLVIAAVFISTKLRTVTNLFIVSLAVADLMVGIAVLPFSATWEIFEIWIFGELWCSMWLAVDVWMCTASILNLCAISMDRYVAVTRPVTYPSIMSSKKAKCLIGAVWVLSFVICFPPLVGWNDRKRTFFRQLITNTSSSTLHWNSSSDLREKNSFNESEWRNEEHYQVEECSLTCELTSDKGYVVYSAIGSFFLPMFVMLFFYWRIYLAAVETTRAINQGFRTTKGGRLIGSRFEEQRLTLRIHRGRSIQNHHHNFNRSTLSPHKDINNGRLSNASSIGGGTGSTRVSRKRSHEKIKVHLTPPPRGNRRGSSGRSRSTTCSSPSTYSPCSSRRPVLSPSPSSSTTGSPLCHTLDLLPLPPSHMGSRRSSHDSDTPSTNNFSMGTEGDEGKPKLISRMGRRNIKAQVKRFRMETKAAKTLGIIVGGFIVCWLPFFIMYVLRAFCEQCIPRFLFSIFFWLGYCNSALNPCIYALFSKDFRFAFKKIICRCVCQREKKTQAVVVPIFLSSLGEDSDGNNETTHLQQHPDGGSDSSR